MGLTIALRLRDEELAAVLTRRLSVLPGLAVQEGLAGAALVITDRVAEAEGLPALVPAEGNAALAALRAGAAGVLPPNAPAADWLAAAQAAARGLVVAPAGALDALLGRRHAEEAAGTALTPREREVLALLADGASNKVIARQLGLSFHTVKAHVAAVLGKLGASSRADAVARGARAGLVML